MSNHTTTSKITINAPRASVWAALTQREQQAEEQAAETENSVLDGLKKLVEGL